MKKLAYLFMMIAGMTLASVNVNAQDAKNTSTTVKKEAAAACCKGGDNASCGKCGSKVAASACTNKDASTTSQNANDKKGACCKAKTELTVSEVKDTKSAK